MKPKLEQLVKLIEREMTHAFNKHGLYHNSHELYAVLLEEVEEFWDSVKANAEDGYELIQVISVAMRYLLERGDISDISLKQYDRWGE